MLKADLTLVTCASFRLSSPFLFTHTIFVSFPSHFFIVYGLSKEEEKRARRQRRVCLRCRMFFGKAKKEENLFKAPHDLLDKQTGSTTRAREAKTQTELEGTSSLTFSRHEENSIAE